MLQVIQNSTLDWFRRCRCRPLSLRTVSSLATRKHNQKWLGRQLSMRILGAKFKFSVGHGKFNFPPLYAEIASSGRIPIVSFAIETIIAVDLKKYHAWIILWRNFVYFSTVTRKNGFKKDRSVRTCRPSDAFSWVCLISSSSLGRLEHSCWIAGLGIATNSCKNNGIMLQACHRRVDREIGDIYSSIHKCYAFTRTLFNYKTAIVIQVS